MNALWIAIASIVLSVLAQFSLKAGMSSAAVRWAMEQPLSLATAIAVFTQRQVAIGFLLYGLGAVVWLNVLAKWDVSKAYPMVGLGFVLTAVIGAVSGEEVTLSRMTGILLVAVGVWFVGRS